MRSKSRNRGIIASRIKLENAMLSAGIKTQAALAERIAEAENITSPPKDTVNKAFRQQKISPATITKIAKVLGVEPYSLYLSKSEAAALKQNVSDGQTKPQYEQFKNSDSFKQNTSKNLTGTIPENYSIAINPFSEEAIGLAKTLKNLLPNKINSVVITDSPQGAAHTALDQASQYQADGVITIRLGKINRFLGIQVFAYTNGVEKLVWIDSILNTDLNEQKENIAQSCIPNLLAFFQSVETIASIGFNFELVQAHKNYLEARQLLCKHSSELNINRAQGLLDLALSSVPDFARAHAAKGEGYLAESWMGNEKQLLEMALASCEKALTLSPDDSYANSIMAGVLGRTGRIIQSASLYDAILKAWPQNVDALSGLGSTLLAAYRQGIEHIASPLKRATACLEQAILIEPDYWHHHSELGIVKYSRGNISGAISSLDAAASLLPNELLLVNVGTMIFCQGDINKAKSLYQKAIDFAPQSYLGYEFMGTACYVQGDFEKSVTLRQHAIDLLDIDGGDFNMWGNLAASYRMTNKFNDAENNYLHALTILERDELRGNLELTGIIHRYLYQLVLNEIKPEKYPVTSLARAGYTFESALETDLDTSGYIAIAEIELIRKNDTNAKQAFKKGIDICPVLSAHPILKILIE